MKQLFNLIVHPFYLFWFLFLAPRKNGANTATLACALTRGRLLDCKDSIGGIKSVSFTQHSTLGTVTETSGEVTAVSGGFTSYQYDCPAHTGNLTDNIQSDPLAGTIFFEQVLNITLHKLTKEDRSELLLLAKNRLAIFVLDNNNNIFLMGAEDGCHLTGGTIVTGTGKGDLNGYTLEFKAEEPEATKMVAFSTDFDTSIEALNVGAMNTPGT